MSYPRRPSTADDYNLLDLIRLVGEDETRRRDGDDSQDGSGWLDRIALWACGALVVVMVGASVWETMRGTW